ncbi:MAG: ABC transporter ATP-binding protein/permease [Clostridiales bacterium]|jgi:ATP-binding cassette subfamily B protein|nr:ABC transporter ATP-binding protein/permease [Clostridiales bacterium]
MTINKDVSLWKVIRMGLKINMAAVPVLYVVISVVAILSGSFHGFGAPMEQRFYDSVQTALGGPAAANTVYASLLALGAVSIVRELLNGLHNFMHSVVFAKCRAETSRLIHAKMGRLDPVMLEDTAVQDMVDKAKEGAGNVIFIMNMGISIFTFYLPYFLVMAWYLRGVNAKLIFAILLVFVPTLIGQLFNTRIVAKFEDKAAPIRRRFEFFNKSITDRAFFKETRLLGAYKTLLERLCDTMKLLSAAEWAANKKTNALQLITTTLSALGWGGIVYLLVTSLIGGEITVGAFAAIFSSVGMMFNIMQEAAGQVGRMAKNFGSGRNLVRLMDLPERGGVPQAADSTKGISLKNVSFQYPNATEPSVSDVSLDVAPGETVAIVGVNGAGKSTLVRLLIGMYKPTRGVVTVRGLDTGESDADSLFNGTSGVFQKFQKYQMTLGENVGISETGRDGDKTGPLANAGVGTDSSTFPDGLDTMLSREFDGVDLSGGQWQRLAIARGLYRTHDLVVLDEPTAAIDPIEETRIYKQFMEISRDKTAIIVTHRLGSVKTADRVLVMDDGRIIASAPHETLLKTCAPYAQMYASQAMWYEE